MKGAAAERIVCLDTSVVVKYLVPDEQDEAATALVLDALRAECRLVAPAFVWAEVGSVLRKKVRAGLLQPDEARDLWIAFLALPFEFVQSPALVARAWTIAELYGLPTLYDAAFLACAEAAPGPDWAVRELWTADRALLARLAEKRPEYVRELGE